MSLPENQKPRTENRRLFDLWACLAISALVAVFFWRLLLLGQIPLNADWLVANFEPWQSLYKHVKVQNAELDDPVILHYPLRLMGRQMLRAGQAPLWNPYVFCGTPLLADSMSHPFCPLNLLLLGLPDDLAWGYGLFLQSLIAGLAFYAYLRHLALSPFGALVGSLCYAFNGFFVVWLELRFAVAVFCWTPLTLLCMDKLIQRPRLLTVALGALTLAPQLLAGNLHHVLNAFALYGCYAACRLVQTRRWRSAWPVAAMFALGMALSAIQLAPTAELTRLAARAPQKYMTINYLDPRELIAFVFPKFFGHPADGNFAGHYLFPRSFLTMNAPYIGLLGLLFAGLGVRRSRMADSGFFLALLCVLMAFLLLLAVQPPHAALRESSLLNALLPVDTLDHHRALVLAAFLLAILAAFGAEDFTRAAGDQARHYASRLAIAAGSLLALVVSFAVIMKCVQALSTPAADKPALLDYVRFLNAHFGFMLFGPPMRPSVLLLLCLCAVAVLAWRYVGRLWPVALLTALLAVDLLYFGMAYNPFVPRDLILPRTGAVEFLADSEPPAGSKPAGGWQEGRFCGLDTPESSLWKGNCLPPATNLAYGLADVRGKEGLFPFRIGAFMELLKDDPKVVFAAAVHFKRPDSRLLDLMGMRYVMSRDPIENPKLREVYRGEVLIYENGNALPRVFTLERDLIKQPATDTESLVAEIQAAHERRTRDKTVLAHHSPHYVRIQARLSQPSRLVLTDTLFPGWRAFADGHRAAIMPFCWLFRSLVADPAAQRLEFCYEPQSFKLGALLTMAAFATTVILLAVGFVARSVQSQIQNPKSKIPCAASAAS